MYLLKKEVAARLRFSPGHVMRLVSKGVLSAPMKMTEGGVCLFDEAQLERDLERAAQRGEGKRDGA